jgi:imidazolonepropionase-like amidohydrolase
LANSVPERADAPLEWLAYAPWGSGVAGCAEDHMRLQIYSAICLAAAVTALSAQTRGPGAFAAAVPTTITNANVVNVRTGEITRNTTVFVRDGKIASIGAAAPAATTTIDARGRYVVPGLIDAHTHIADFASARRALDSGVTTVRSAGVSNYADVGLRELAKKGAIAGPDVLAAGYHVRPQLALEAFVSDPGLSPFMNGGVTTSDAIRQVVRTNLSHGVDWIKTTSTERAGLPDTDPRKQLYTQADVKVMVDEAASKGIPVMAHAHGEEGALAAVNAGVRSIEHGTYLSDEALKLMKEKGTFLVPTYATVIDLVHPGGDYDNPGLHLRGSHMLPRLRETVQKAQKLGVKIVTGADTGYGPNSVTRIAHEMAAFAEFGMTPVQALQSATTLAAELLRIEKGTGAIEMGLDADLIIVERNPLEELRTLQDPLLVMSNGRVAVNRLSFGKTPSTEDHP